MIKRIMNNTLTELCVCDNMDNYEQLFELLKTNTSVNMIFTTISSYDEHYLNLLGELLKVNKTITDLRLNLPWQNSIDHRSQLLWNHLIDAMKINKTLTHIGIHIPTGHFISIDDCKYIAQILKVNTTLNSINMFSANIYLVGLHILLDALYNNQNTIIVVGSTIVDGHIQMHVIDNRIQLKIKELAERNIHNRYLRQSMLQCM
jgi:hypothetical protein